MAAYPAISFVFGSDETVKDGVVVDRSMAGTARGRNLFIAKKRVYVLKHAHVTAADKSTLETFYDANRALPVSLTWTDGVTRSVILTGIKITPGENLPAGRRWDVQIMAEEV